MPSLLKMAPPLIIPVLCRKNVSSEGDGGDGDGSSRGGGSGGGSLSAPREAIWVVAYAAAVTAASLLSSVARRSISSSWDLLLASRARMRSSSASFIFFERKVKGGGISQDC